MTPTDRERFASLLTDVLAFYGQKVSTFALSVWWEACQGLDLAIVQRALSRHAMDPERGMFPPKPADIVRQVQGTPTDRASRAWSRLIEAASRVGAYTDVAFDDPTIHAVVEDMGGWPTVCRTEAANLSYQQHRFTEAYRGYVNRGDLDRYPPRLIGDRSPDETYTSRGLPPPKPVLIGDPEKARQVMRGGTAGARQITSAVAIAEEAIARIERTSREDVA